MVITISGAGISGLSAAITMKHEGREVEIRDKASSIKEKISRGINTLRNYNLKTDIIQEYSKLGFNLAGFHPIYKQIYYIDEDRYFEINSENKPLFYTIPRGTEKSIDNMLIKQAKSLDIDIQWNSTFKKPDILATGSKYVHCIGYGEHFIDVDETDTIFIIQNSKYCPFGYACILPFGKNEATIILGSFNPTENVNIKKLYEKLKNEVTYLKEFINGTTIQYQLSGIGNFGYPNSAIHGTTLIVGERAGFLEAFRGFGIHNAIISGHIAAKANLFSKNYNEMWKEQLGNELQRGMIRRFAENLHNIGSEKILVELSNTLPKKSTLEEFRSELKKIEKRFLDNLDISHIFNQLTEWDLKYPFSLD